MATSDLYSPVLLEHSSDPEYKYQMDDATCTREGVNPTCGDELELSNRLDKDGVIEEAAFEGGGCAISQASADMMAELITGKTVQEARDLCDLFERMTRGEVTDPAELEKLGDAACLASISRMPARVKCAQLAWRTLDEMTEGK